jgi:triosephosphate isomerase (TIM)
LRTLIINFKNYPEVLGEGSVSLARVAEEVSRDIKANIIVSPPLPMMGLVSRSVGIPVYSQTVGKESGDKTTGAITLESVKGAGAKGTILNHSESRLNPSDLERLVPTLTRNGLEVCLCAESAKEAGRLGRLAPTFLAVEPPELIGSGVSVSRARPDAIRDTLAAARESGYRGQVLCGAGIVDGADVTKAVELGAEGVLVASSIVKAKEWRSKVAEIAGSLI